MALVILLLFTSWDRFIMSNPLLVNCIFKNCLGCVLVLNSGSLLTLRKRLKLARFLMLRGICLGSLPSISNVSQSNYLHFLGKLNMYTLSLFINPGDLYLSSRLCKSVWRSIVTAFSIRWSLSKLSSMQDKQFPSNKMGISVFRCFLCS